MTSRPTAVPDALAVTSQATGVPGMNAAMESEPAFFTMGMFIIDEIEFTKGRQPERNVIGGAGTYAALGARLAAGPEHASQVSWIVDKGSDFPAELVDIIDRWQTSCRFRFDANRLTTRAWNGYGANEFRSFRYLTAKKRLEQADLTDHEVCAASFHMVCSPLRCLELVKSIKKRRGRVECVALPMVVWEPIPDLCIPEELNNLQSAAHHVDLISPNGDELAQLFVEANINRSRLEMVHALVAQVEAKSRPPVVVRDGADGSRLYCGDLQLHFRAYHQTSERVIDPTGGGNTFLGALAIGLTGRVRPNSFEKHGLTFLELVPSERPESKLKQHVLAVVHATIAASFAIEQVGVPRMAPVREDCWNGQMYRDRFDEYLQREHAYLKQQLTPQHGHSE